MNKSWNKITEIKYKISKIGLVKYGKNNVNRRVNIGKNKKNTFLRRMIQDIHAYKYLYV